MRFGFVAAQVPARIEIHSIPSVTISDEQFLKGESAGKPVTVSGMLRIAQGSSRLPAVVLIHGSGGMGANIDYWSRELNEMGSRPSRSMRRRRRRCVRRWASS